MIYKFFGLIFLLTLPIGVFAGNWRRDIEKNSITTSTIQDGTQGKENLSVTSDKGRAPILS